MPGRVLARSAELKIGIDGIHVGNLICGWQLQFAAKQPLVQKPDAARVEAGRLLAHEFGDVALLYGKEKPLQNGKVQPLVLEGESQVPLKGRLGRMARRVDAPAILLNNAVLGPYCAKKPGNRNGQLVSANECGIASRSGCFWQPPVMKNTHRP